MTILSMETILNTTADDAWKMIRCFNGVIKYLPAVLKSTREGSGAGSVRTLVLSDGGRVVERLEEVDESPSPFLTYSIITSPLPIEKYFATMRVQGLDGSRCKLIWSSTFTPKGISDVEAVEIVRKIYLNGFKRLETLYDS